MAVLQGAFDESLGGGVYVLAGYVARASDWLPFSDEWSDALLRYSNGERFKMSEAASRWSPELQKERVGYLHSLIMKHASFGVSVIVDPEILDRVMIKFPDQRFRKPQFFSFFMLIQQLMVARSDWIGEDKIQFIFDRGGGDEKKIDIAWNHFIESAPAIHKNRIIGKAEFRDDESWAPLQAADLKAWWIRRRFYEDRNGLTRRALAWKEVSTFQNLNMHFNEEILIKSRDEWLMAPRIPIPEIIENRGGLSIRYGSLEIEISPPGQIEGRN